MAVLYCGYCGKNLSELGCKTDKDCEEHLRNCRGVFNGSG